MYFIGIIPSLMCATQPGGNRRPSRLEPKLTRLQSTSELLSEFDANQIMSGIRHRASSQLKNLIRLRHFNASIGKMSRKLLYGVFFAVDKERMFRSGPLLPSQQLRLVGMSGETVNGVDASANWNIFTENVHVLLAVDNTPRESPTGCVADEHDARIRATEIVLEMVAHAAAGTHARAGHDDGSAMDTVYCNGFGGLPCEMQSW